MPQSDSLIPTDDTRPAAAVDSLSSPQRGHIPSLDGLRGLAALYIVFHHAHRLCLDASGSDASLPRTLARGLKVFAFGHCAVALFIVLSGFVLMLPVVQTPDHHLRGGIGNYLTRRARRILPPYYGALLLTLLLIFVQPLALYHPDGEVTRGTVISHLLMIHNLLPQWHYAINTPMWSVATEWDLYFVFPLLLLPVWRRSGIGALLCVAAIAAVGPQLFHKPFLDWASPWFIMLFALGMAAAAISCDPHLMPSQRASLRRSSGWLALLLIPLFLGCYALKGVIYPHWPVGYYLALDISFGLHAASLLVFCAIQSGQSNQAVSPIVRFAQMPVCLTLGRFSYSLYLVHWPILVLAHGWMVQRGWGIHAIVIGMFLMTGPAVATGYVFYLVFEKPFLSKKNKPRSPTPLLKKSSVEHMPVGNILRADLRKPPGELVR